MSKTPLQQNNTKTKSSDSSWQKLKQYTPGGSQTLSKQPSRYVEGVYPKVLDSGFGGHVFDVDGNEYIDLVSGLGAVSVGYSDADINKAIVSQLGKGVSFSFPTNLEWRVAKRLTELVPGTEMWKFGKNGTDGTVMAVRAARAYTGRTKIMTVGYNGCADVFECVGVRNAGIPTSLKDHIKKAVYNDIKSFLDLENKEYACVLMEPMVYEFPIPGFLESLVDLCEATGTLLIMDEVVTGGRFKDFVAQIGFRIVPDLTVLSKGIANGLPLSAVGGKRSIMATFERDDFFASGTFGGECVSLQACLATVDRLEQSVIQMVNNGFMIQQYFNYLFRDMADCKGYPTRLTFDFPIKEQKALFMQEMCLNGVLIGYSNFIMASHTTDDVRQIMTAMEASYVTLYQYWTNPLDAMKGKLPQEVLLRKN